MGYDEAMEFIPQWLTDSQKLDKILFELDIISKRMDKMAATISDVDAAAIAAENATLTSLAALSNQLVIDVAALVTKANTGVDFTPELNAIQANASLLQTAVSNVGTADTSSLPVVPPAPPATGFKK